MGRFVLSPPLGGRSSRLPQESGRGTVEEAHKRKKLVPAPVPRKPLPAFNSVRARATSELHDGEPRQALPSGLTAEHLLPVLDNDTAAGAFFFQVADLLTNEFIFPEAHAAIRLESFFRDPRNRCGRFLQKVGRPNHRTASVRRRR